MPLIFLAIFLTQGFSTLDCLQFFKDSTIDSTLARNSDWGLLFPFKQPLISSIPYNLEQTSNCLLVQEFLLLCHIFNHPYYVMAFILWEVPLCSGSFPHFLCQLAFQQDLTNFIAFQQGKKQLLCNIKYTYVLHELALWPFWVGNVFLRYYNEVE